MPGMRRDNPGPRRKEIMMWDVVCVPRSQLSTSVAFSPLETNSSTQTAYHQAAYPDQAVTQRCPALASNQSRTRSRWDRPTQLGQLLNDTEGKEKTLIDKGNRLTTQLSSDRGRAGQSHVPPSLLCPTVGARGLKNKSRRLCPRTPRPNRRGDRGRGWNHKKTPSPLSVDHDENDERKEKVEWNRGRRPSSPEPNSMAGRVCARSAGDELDEHKEKEVGEVHRCECNPISIRTSQYRNQRRRGTDVKHQTKKPRSKYQVQTPDYLRDDSCGWSSARRLQQVGWSARRLRQEPFDERLPGTTNCRVLRTTDKPKINRVAH